MSPQPKPPAEPDPAPAPDSPPDPGEPQWARDLRQQLAELPGKLRATISDDDRRGIAETVHGLFESSGAFERETAPKDDPADEPKDEVVSSPTDPGPEGDSLARRWFGRW